MSLHHTHNHRNQRNITFINATWYQHAFVFILRNWTLNEGSMGSSHLRLWVQFDVWRGFSVNTHNQLRMDTNPTMLTAVSDQIWDHTCEDMWQCMAPPTGCTTSFPLIQREIPAGQHNLQQKYDTDIIYVFLNGRTLIPDIRPWTEIPPIQKSPNVETNIVVYIHKKKYSQLILGLSRNTFKGIVRIKRYKHRFYSL